MGKASVSKSVGVL